MSVGESMQRLPSPEEAGDEVEADDGESAVSTVTPETRTGEVVDHHDVRLHSYTNTVPEP